MTATARSAQRDLLADLDEALRDLARQGLRRQITAIESVDGPLVRVNGQPLVSWCSNDYLGLSTHPALIDAAAHASRAFGVGARASRLLAGTTSVHVDLEERLAAWFGAERALVFPSGYLANLGALGALLSAEDVAYLDRSAHASLIDAARASRATVRLFRHNDVSHLETLLARGRRGRRQMIVTEGVFSMEGDAAPLADILELAERHDALVYLDDAHGAFVLGERGRGAPEASGVSHDRLLYMATLGKALGCQGGFVIGPSGLIEYLGNRAKTFIYATALAVPVAAAASAALQLLDTEPALRGTLHERVQQLHELLRTHRLVRQPSSSHIVPVLMGESARASRMAEALLQRGIWAPAIRPPTVPRGTARMRLSVNVRHTEAQIRQLAQALTGVMRDV